MLHRMAPGPQALVQVLAPLPTLGAVRLSLSSVLCTTRMAAAPGSDPA